MPAQITRKLWVLGVNELVSYVTLSKHRYAAQMDRERTGETWDNALLYVLKMEVEFVPEFSPSDGVVIVHVGDDAAEGRLRMWQDLPYSISHYAPLAVELLKNEAFSHVMLIDGARISHEWPREAASRQLGPVAKPVTRVLQKLNPSACTLVAIGARNAEVLLKLVVHKALPESTKRLVFAECSIAQLPAQLRQLLKSPSPEPLVGAGVAVEVLSHDPADDRGWSLIARAFASAPVITFLEGMKSADSFEKHKKI